jgi:hypothetical protein
LRPRPWLVAPAIVALAAGCLGSSTAQPPLTGGQAVRQARADGFTGVERRSAGSWHCDRFGVDFGPLATTGKYESYRRPSYQLSMGDKRVPLTKNGTGRILIGVVVFPDASTAARCARALLWETDHPRVSFVVGRRQPAIPHRMVSPVTMETHMHKAGAPGNMFPDDGEYDTAFATGRVLAMGLAYTRPTSRIVEADLERIASQIAG